MSQLMRFKRMHGDKVVYLSADRGGVRLVDKDLVPQPLYLQFRDAALLTFRIEDAMARSGSYTSTREEVCALLNAASYCPESAWEIL